MPIKLLSLLLLVVACQSGPSGSEVTGERIDASSIEATPPTLNADTSAACIPYTAADAYLTELASYTEALEMKAASERGWRLLTELAVAQYDPHDPSVFLPPYGMTVAEHDEDHLVDSEGNTWLALDSWSCAPNPGPFYIDEAHAVFRIHGTLPCRTVEPVTVCGSWPVGGCGVEPEYSDRRYAKAPRDARYRPDGQVVELQSMDCYTFEPEDGYEHPP